jgi:hypothetical protein
MKDELKVFGRKRSWPSRDTNPGIDGTEKKDETPHPG